MAIGSQFQGGKELAFRCQAKGLALLERAAFPSPLSLAKVGTSLGKEERDDNKGLSGVFSCLVIEDLASIVNEKGVDGRF